jgi:glutamyl-tRNA reductase
MMKILLVGLSYRTAPIDVRERLALTPAMLRSALTHFDSIHLQAHLSDVREGVILSTCNRLEVYALVRDRHTATKAIVNFLAHAGDIAPETLAKHLYVCHDEAAGRHLMRVAAGLDSMVLGEPQILGQITEAYEAALSQKAAGTVLSALFRAAIHVGKRVRAETAIGVNATSISAVAANLAAQLLGDLSQRHILLIGAGEMGGIAVRALIRRGASYITVANRSYDRAMQLAQAWNGQAVSFQQFPAALAEADIVITSTGAPHPILSQSLLESAMAARGGRPLFIIDIAVPRDVDPRAAAIPNVHLRDIDDLRSQAGENLREREAEIPQVEKIVAEELNQFMGWLASLGAVSTITDLRQQTEQWRQRELERLFSRLDLDEREQNLVTAMSHRLVNKILHQPTVRLKAEAAQGNGATYIDVTRKLFSL